MSNVLDLDALTVWLSCWWL